MSATAAIIAGGAALAGSALSSASQSNVNRTNMRIAQMNNEWSEKMLDKQLRYNTEQWQREADYNTDMWNKTNEWNSASAQAKRFREAGLNPALMMGPNSAGTAQSSSAPSGNSIGLPSPSTPTLQATRYDFSGIGRAVENYFLLDAERSRKSAETNWLNTQSAVASAKAAEEVRNYKLKNDLMEMTQDFDVAIKNENYLNEVQKRYTAAEQEKLVKQQRIAQELVNAQLPDKLVMEISVLASQMDLNKANSKHEVEKLFEILERRGYKLSEKEKRAIFAAIIQEVETQQYRGLNPWNTAIGILNRE